MNEFVQLRLFLTRNVREGFRSPVLAYVLPIAVPLATLLTVAQTLARVTDLQGFPTNNYAQWLTPAIVMVTALTGMGWSAASLIIDIQSGFLDRLQILDAKPAMLLLSRVVFDALRIVPAGAAVLVAGITMGTDFHANGVRIALMLALLTVWAAAYSGLSFVVTLVTGNIQASFALLPLAIPLQFLSTCYFPAALLPEWIQSVSRWNPLTYMVDASRALTTGPYAKGAIVEAFVIAFALLVMSLAASLLVFARRVESS